MRFSTVSFAREKIIFNLIEFKIGGKKIGEDFPNEGLLGWNDQIINA